MMGDQASINTDGRPNTSLQSGSTPMQPVKQDACWSTARTPHLGAQQQDARKVGHITAAALGGVPKHRPHAHALQRLSPLPVLDAVEQGGGQQQACVPHAQQLNAGRRCCAKVQARQQPSLHACLAQMRPGLDTLARRKPRSSASPICPAAGTAVMQVTGSGSRNEPLRIRLRIRP